MDSQQGSDSSIASLSEGGLRYVPQHKAKKLLLRCADMQADLIIHMCRYARMHIHGFYIPQPLPLCPCLEGEMQFSLGCQVARHSLCEQKCCNRTSLAECSARARHGPPAHVQHAVGLVKDEAPDLERMTGLLLRSSESTTRPQEHSDNRIFY